MEKFDLDRMPLDDLWALHEQVTRVLSARIIAQKQELEQRLLQLNVGAGPDLASKTNFGALTERGERRRRSYPQVLPKFQNPASPGETWSGRGKQPRWLVAALKAGGRMEDFEISK